MGKLTAIEVKTVGPGRYSDGQGLCLLVKPNGTRFWVLRVQHDGTRRDVGLGKFEAPKRHNKMESIAREGELGVMDKQSLTLAEAREKAALLRKFTKAGKDPVAERDKDTSPPPTFFVALTRAHESFADNLSNKEADAFLASLTQHALPALGKKRVDLIDANDIAEALKPIWTTKPEVARKVRQRIGKVLKYAWVQKWRSVDAPNAELSLLLGKQPKGKHFPAMPYNEVPAYLMQLENSSETVGRAALIFVIATACRSQEARLAKWEHIDLATRLWKRPASIMKSGEAHEVTLNDTAIAILKKVAQLRLSLKGDEWVFPSLKHNPLSDMTLSKIMKDDDQKFVPHGFRSSFRDWAADKMPHIPDAVAEAALAHAVSDRVVAAYKRTQFLDMRFELLDGWNAYLTHR